jgi:MerR family regulatory protein
VTVGRLVTIGAASRLASVPVWQLRSWERAGLLTPQRSASGYRMYNSRDIASGVQLRSEAVSGDRLCFYGGEQPAATSEDRLSPSLVPHLPIRVPAPPRARGPMVIDAATTSALVWQAR